MLGQADLQLLQERGIAVEEVNRQIKLFEQPPPYVELDRPCRLADGICVLSESDCGVAQERYEEACGAGRLSKFVPASGAASRMFESLQWSQNEWGQITWGRAHSEAEKGVARAKDLLKFAGGLDRFAFRDDLRAVMHVHGHSMDRLAAQGEFTEIIDALLTANGLDYAASPKGLLKFHCYPEESRTAFEEHLIEATAYLRDTERRCRAHFTVSPEHLNEFQRLFDRVRATYERRYDAVFEVGFSSQRQSTDTLAVDLENRPLRTAGQLLFRPSGHGALIDNLSELQADIVHLQNIDNVLPDHLRAETVRWKQLLIGHLLVNQRRVFDYLSRLAVRERISRHLLDEAQTFVEHQLAVPGPADFHTLDVDMRRSFLIERLDRPIRVCGMVPNIGEPGGGPFWIRDPHGVLMRQIVERAQVEPDSSQQQSVYASATHFNPVMIVAGVRGWRGQPFELRQFIDPEAVFIARKSQGGQALKTLERPGLWNGGMAHWNTIFVEVPAINFAPVKTVNDLLRPEHQRG